MRGKWGFWCGTLGFLSFFGSNKKVAGEKSSDLDSLRLNECKGKKWRAFGANCGFYREKKQGRKFIFGHFRATL